MKELEALCQLLSYHSIVLVVMLLMAGYFCRNPNSFTFRARYCKDINLLIKAVCWPLDTFNCVVVLLPNQYKYPIRLYTILFFLCLWISICMYWTSMCFHSILSQKTWHWQTLVISLIAKQWDSSLGFFFLATRFLSHLSIPHI